MHLERHWHHSRPDPDSRQAYRRCCSQLRMCQGSHRDHNQGHIRQATRCHCNHCLSVHTHQECYCCCSRQKIHIRQVSRCHCNQSTVHIRPECRWHCNHSSIGNCRALRLCCNRQKCRIHQEYHFDRNLFHKHQANHRCRSRILQARTHRGCHSSHSPMRHQIRCRLRPQYRWRCSRSGGTHLECHLG